MAGANWPRYIAANVCHPGGKLAPRTAGVGLLEPDDILQSRRAPRPSFPHPPLPNLYRLRIQRRQAIISISVSGLRWDYSEE
jgi:hypothetical protein